MSRLKSISMKHKSIIIITIMLLAVGFAAVTGTLIINGNIIFATNDDDFDVIFTKASIDGIENNSVISSDGKTITYETKILEHIGDLSELDYTVTNNSSQYDAEVVVSCEFTDNDYVKIDNTLQNEIIEAKSEREGTLSVELIKTSVTEQELEVKCTLDATAKERETTGTVTEEDTATYSLYGYLVDENDNPLPNVAMVIYSNPLYGVTTTDGYIYLEGMESGSHTLYVMGEKTIAELETLSEEEIKINAVTMLDITNNTINIVFPNGYKLIDATIDKTTKYNIEFDANGGELEETTKEVVVGLTYGELPIPERVGYQFQGWHTIDIKVENNTLVLNNESHTLIAKWEANTYTVTLNANGGDIDNETITVTYNDTYANLPTPVREGYNFAYWKDEDDNIITSTTVVSVADNHTLIAEWTNGVYEVTFDANGGTSSETSKTITYDTTYGELPTATRTGNTFAGWWTDASNGTEVTTNTKVTTGSNHTLYAHWTPNTYTVNFNANTGSVSTTNKTVIYDGTYGTLPTPTKPRYSFSGWYTAATGGSEVTSASEVNITETQTLYAHWTSSAFADGEAIYYNVSTGALCSANDYKTSQSEIGIKTGCMKFYAFNDAIGATTIDFILDHTITSGVVWTSATTNAAGPKEVLTQLQNDTKDWVGVLAPTSYTLSQSGYGNYTLSYSGYKARLITVGEIAKITKFTTFSESTYPNAWFYIGSGNQTDNTQIEKYRWLFNNQTTTTDLGYWTSSSAYGSQYVAWFVNYEGYVSDYGISRTTVGVRPVIKLSASLF